VTGDFKPIEIKIEPGPHQLRVSKQGFVTVAKDLDLTEGRAPPLQIRLEPAKVAPVKSPPSVLPQGTVWVGKRSYRKGLFAGNTVTYELHVREREGAKFNGHVFDNGPGRNRADVEGEVKGDTLSWREQSNFNPNTKLTIQGTLNGDTIRLRFQGDYGKGVTNEGEGELTLRQK